MFALIKMLTAALSERMLKQMAPLWNYLFELLRNSFNHHVKTFGTIHTCWDYCCDAFSLLCDASCVGWLRAPRACIGPVAPAAAAQCIYNLLSRAHTCIIYCGNVLHAWLNTGAQIHPREDTGMGRSRLDSDVPTNSLTPKRQAACSTFKWPVFTRIHFSTNRGTSLQTHRSLCLHKGSRTAFRISIGGGDGAAHCSHDDGGGMGKGL